MLELQVGDDLDVQVALDRVRLRVAGLLPPGAYRQPVAMLDIADRAVASAASRSPRPRRPAIGAGCEPS